MKLDQLKNIKQLKDTELKEKIKSLASQERRLTKVILEHIAEIDRRKLFLSMAYSSLFDYLIKEIGYAAGAAQRRIDAARLIQRIPEVSAKIESGDLNLGQISKMQQICRQIKKESGRAVSSDVQKKVLSKIENLNSQQTDLTLAQEFQLEIKTCPKMHIQRDQSTRVELTFSKHEMTIIKAAQAAMSHKTGGGLKETLLALANDVLKAKKSTATVAVKTLTPRLKNEILQRDKFCQFIDQNTGKACGSQYYLEIDHIFPRFAGGDNSTQNLRTLCKNHNIYRYEAGF